MHSKQQGLNNLNPCALYLELKSILRPLQYKHTKNFSQFKRSLTRLPLFCQVESILFWCLCMCRYMDTRTQGHAPPSSQFSDGFLCASVELLNDRTWYVNHLWEEKHSSKR